MAANPCQIVQPPVCSTVHIVHQGADADPLAEFVVMVAGHVGHELLAIG